MLLWKIEVGGGYLMISYHLLVDKLCVEWLLKNTICFANHRKGLFVKERKDYNSFITCYLQRFSNNPKLKWYLLFFSKSKIQKNHLFTDWKFKFWYWKIKSKQIDDKNSPPLKNDKFFKFSMNPYSFRQGGGVMADNREKARWN